VTRTGTDGGDGRPHELRLLVVEDSPDDYELMLRSLRRSGSPSVGRRVETEEELREALADGDWDAVIADHVVPGFSGPRAIEVVREVVPDTAVVVVSGKVDEAVIAEDIRRGADDYVFKENLARLAPSLETALHSAGQRRRRRLLEEDARRQSDLLEQVFLCAPDPIMLVDRDVRVWRINRAGLAMAGSPEDEAVGRLCGDVFACLESFTEGGCGQTPDCPDCAVRSRVEETFRTGGSIREAEGTMVLKGPAGPRQLELLVSTALVKAHDEELCLLTLTDVTRRRQAERAQRDSEDRYRRVVEGASEGLLELDPEYRIVSVNDRWLAMMGYGREEVLGRQVHGFLFEEDLADLEANRELRRQGIAGRHERRFRRADGEQLWAFISAVPRMDEDGRLDGVVALWLDITEERRLQTALQESAARLERTVEGAISAMGATVEMRDPYTAGHERRVTRLAEGVAAELGLADDVTEGLRLAGSVHDIGKIAVPAEILSKPGRLQEYELNLVRTHAQVGYDILRPIEFAQPVAEIVLQHHERLDGSGYPRGLAGDHILPEARILAVADVIEAMSSHRPYRPALGLDAAREEVLDGAGSRYDPAVVDACERVLSAGFSFDAD